MMLKKYSALLLLFFFIHGVAHSQKNECGKDYMAFEPGERLEYKISYNWLFIWTDVGNAILTVKNSVKFGNPAYHIRGYGYTTENWDFFFKVRDVYETWVNPQSLRPYYYRRDIHEDDFKLDINYTYEQDSNVVYSWSQRKGREIKQDTVEVPGCTFDIISALYHSRCIDYSNYGIGDTIPVEIMLDRKLTPLYFRYMGKETIKVKGLGKVQCKKFSLLVVAGSVFDGGEDLKLWVTDDDNNIPVYAESPIIVGKVKIRLKSYSGTRFPVDVIDD
jgi:hypothetical protein